MRLKFIQVLPAHSLRGRLARGAFWSMAGVVASQGVSAVTAILVARILGKALYGELGMVQSTLVMFGTFAGLALGYTANKHVAEFRQTDPDRAGRIIGMATLVALTSSLFVMTLVLLFADQLAMQTLKAPQLANYIRISSPILPLLAIAGVQNGALAGFEAFKAQSTFAGLIAVINCIAMAGGAWYGSVRGAVWGYVISNIAAVIVYRVVLRAQLRRYQIRIHYSHALRERRLLWSFALPTMLSGIMVAPVSWAANAMLFGTADGPSEMGIFNATNQWRNMLMILPGVISAPLLPIMCQLFAQHEIRRLRGVLVRSIGLNVALVGSFATVLALASPFILRLYGSGFEKGVPTFLAILGVAVLLAAGNVVGDLLVATGEMWMGFWFNSIWAMIVLFTAWPLTARYGAFGLALAYLIAYTVHTIIQMAYLWTHVSAGRSEQISGHSALL